MGDCQDQAPRQPVTVRKINSAAYRDWLFRCSSRRLLLLGPRIVRAPDLQLWSYREIPARSDHDPHPGPDQAQPGVTGHRSFWQQVKPSRNGGQAAPVVFPPPAGGNSPAPPATSPAAIRCPHRLIGESFGLEPVRGPLVQRGDQGGLRLAVARSAATRRKAGDSGTTGVRSPAASGTGCHARFPPGWPLILTHPGRHRTVGRSAFPRTAVQDRKRRRSGGVPSSTSALR